jgi:DNA invertase Pin-like site-specific DNA recombinase
VSVGKEAVRLERGQLRRMLELLGAGDRLMVTRLARSKRDLLNTAKATS